MRVSESKHKHPQPDILSYDINFTSTIIMEDEYSISKTVAPVQKPAASLVNIQEASATKEKCGASKDTVNPRQNDSTKADKKHHRGKESSLKSSLKNSDSKKATCSVTWADEKSNVDRQNLRECRELKDGEGALTPHPTVEEAGEESYRVASAEACAKALSQAAEAVASGKSDASDAGMEFFRV